ncbi:MAG: winged helix-turn-helix domain-containing protein [Candidatus Bathyarchaeia archaeon]|jgi:predicted transcriptional regulator
MINNNRSIKQLLGWLITGTKGGKTRAQIIKILKKTPQNSNQLATLLKVNYKTIRHHVAILEKNKLIISAGDHYSTAYFLSELMEENYVLFEEITSKTKDTQKKTELSNTQNNTQTLPLTYSHDLS